MDKENTNFLKRELRKAFMHARDTLSSFQSTIADKNIVIFLGNTRCGKSTLINYIIGTSLIAFTVRKDLYKIGKEKEDTYGPRIGHGALSDTAIPGVYHMISPLSIFAIDAPGFGDNRGEVQNIINAVFVNQIKHAKSCRFVLVHDINEIAGDNIGGFLAFVAKVTELMPNFENLKNSVCLVVTKDNGKYTQDEIASLLKKQILEVPDLNISENSRRLISCFVDKSELIALFRMPTAEGQVTSEVDVNILGAILCTTPLVMHTIQVHFGISNEARLALLEVYREFTDQMNFEEELIRIISKYQNYFEIDNYVFASTSGELHRTKCSLTYVMYQLYCELNTFMVNIQDVRNSLKRLIQLDAFGELDKTLMLFLMLDEATLMEQKFKAQLIQKYKCALHQLHAKVNNLKARISDEERARKEENLGLNSKLTMTGASMGVAMVGGALLRGVTMKTAAARVVGACTGIGTALTVAGTVASIASYVIQHKQVKKRKTARRLQGRPLPNKDAQ